jgi:hypothetical protein
VTLDWSDVSGATGYEVQIGSSCDTGTIYPTTASNYVFSCSPGQTYYWQVRAKNACDQWSLWTSCWSFTPGGGCTLPPPTLLLPPDGAGCQTGTVTLDWSDVTGAVGYRIQLTKDCDRGPEYDVTSSQFSFASPYLVTFYWRVKSRCSNGSYGPYGSCFTFSTVGPPPLPTLLSPTDGSFEPSCPVTLDWSEVPGAVLYSVQIGSSCGTGTAYPSATSGYSFDCAPNQTYYWQVRAQNACGQWSPPTTCWSFFTGSQRGGSPQLNLAVQNPCPPNSGIVLEVGQAREVEVSVYDVQGQRIQTLLTGMVGPGTYVMGWDGRGVHGELLGSGIYYLRATLGDQTMVRRIMLVR